MVYKYKDKSDAAKVHSAPTTGRRASYSRSDNADRIAMPETSIVAGMELRAAR